MDIASCIKKRYGIEDFEFASLLRFVVSFINPRYGPPEKVICVIKEFARLLSFAGSFINPRFMCVIKEFARLLREGLKCDAENALTSEENCAASWQHCAC